VQINEQAPLHNLAMHGLVLRREAPRRSVVERRRRAGRLPECPLVAGGNDLPSAGPVVRMNPDLYLEEPDQPDYDELAAIEDTRAADDADDWRKER